MDRLQALEIADNAVKVSSPFLCLPDCTPGWCTLSLTS